MTSERDEETVRAAPDDEAAERGDEEATETAADLDDEASPASLDDVDVRDLLRGALRPPPGSVAPGLLRGVQRKIRVRSRGKFYGDGWSTASAPRSTYLITAVIMLVVIALVALSLVPWGAGQAP